MSSSELTTRNYRRIYYINCLLVVPLLVIFAWPYIIFSRILTINAGIFYPGAGLFSFPFMLTILHGHVMLSIGSVHRHHYYEWLQDRPLTYGLLYHPILTSTRFRLVIFALSAILFLIGWLIRF